MRLDLAMGTGDDPYDGLDRFDRVQDQRWYDYGASADAARIKHGYDRAGNRLWREDPVAAANSKNFDELYAYDGIYRLDNFERGDLNSSKTGMNTGTLNFEHEWGFDPLGNWTSFKEDAAGDGTFELDQTRTVNKANEITGITGGSWVVPAYDRNGNMTTMPQPAAPTSSYTATYDAWNRLVKLQDGSNTVAEYQYDGQRWRIVTKSYTGGSLSETRHHYYSAQWQIVEERVGTSSNPDRQFVWGLRYIDDLVLSDRDTNSNGSLDERLYALQDANWNVIALVDTAGDAQERYLYSAYGQPTVLTGSFGSRSSSSYDWETRYAGYRWDASSGLYHVRMRYFHPLAGIWISRDLWASGPELSNLYTYALHNPILLTDPSGTIPCPICILVVVAGVAIFVGVGCGGKKPAPKCPALTSKLCGRFLVTTPQVDTSRNTKVFGANEAPGFRIQFLPNRGSTQQPPPRCPPCTNLKLVQAIKSPGRSRANFDCANAGGVTKCYPGYHDCSPERKSDSNTVLPLLELESRAGWVSLT